MFRTENISFNVMCKPRYCCLACKKKMMAILIKGKFLQIFIFLKLLGSDKDLGTFWFAYFSHSKFDLFHFHISSETLHKWKSAYMSFCTQFLLYTAFLFVMFVNIHVFYGHFFFNTYMFGHVFGLKIRPWNVWRNASSEGWFQLYIGSIL